MRNVLIAAAGLALLAAPSAARAQDPFLEFRGSDKVTTCEVWGDVTTGGNPVDQVRLMRGGLDPDIIIEGVEPFFRHGPDNPLRGAGRDGAAEALPGNNRRVRRRKTILSFLPSRRSWKTCTRRLQNAMLPEIRAASTCLGPHNSGWKSSTAVRLLVSAPTFSVARKRPAVTLGLPPGGNARPRPTRRARGRRGGMRAIAASIETTAAAAVEERERALDVLRRHVPELRARPDPPCAVRLDRARRRGVRERRRSVDRGRCRARLRPVRVLGPEG